MCISNALKYGLKRIERKGKLNLSVLITGNKLQWELCQAKFSVEFEIDNENYKLLNYEEPGQENYLVLESYSSLKSKTIHIIEISKEKVNGKLKPIELLLGRVSSLDIRVADPSVSRVHSKISLYKGEFYIKDLDSKFGTLIRQRYPLPIPNKWGYRLAIQIIEAYWEISPQFPLWKICCCWGKDNKNIHPQIVHMDKASQMMKYIPENFK